MKIIKRKIKFYLARLPAMLSAILLLYYFVIILRDFINFTVSNYSDIDVFLYEAFPVLAPTAMVTLMLSFVFFSSPREKRDSDLLVEEFRNLSYEYKDVKNIDGLHQKASTYCAMLGQSGFYFSIEDKNKSIQFEHQADVFTRVKIKWENPLFLSGLVGIVKHNFPKEIRYYDENKLLYILTIGADLRIKRITDNRTDEVLFLEDQNEVRDYEW